MLHSSAKPIIHFFMMLMEWLKFIFLVRCWVAEFSNLAQKQAIFRFRLTLIFQDKYKHSNSPAVLPQTLAFVRRQANCRLVFAYTPLLMLGVDMHIIQQLADILASMKSQKR